MAQDSNQVSTAMLRSQIVRTRDELSHTIDAIQDRLSPRRMMHEVKESISDATIGRARRLAHRVADAANSGNGSSNVSAVLDKARRNPAVTALIGTAASALLLAVTTRSRRPKLARSLGGLAFSLAMATLAQHRSERQPRDEQYPSAF